MALGGVPKVTLRIRSLCGRLQLKHFVAVARFDNGNPELGRATNVSFAVHTATIRDALTSLGNVPNVETWLRVPHQRRLQENRCWKAILSHHLAAR